MMRLLLLVIAALLLASCSESVPDDVEPGQGRQEATELFVSRAGDDANAGTKERPFKTLQRARDATRQIRRDREVIIYLRGGSYFLERPLELTATDARSADSPVSYRAWPGEEVRLSGGQRVTQWGPVTDAAVLARLPVEAHGKVVQADLKELGITDYGTALGGGLELFFQGKPMTLARWPNSGFVHIAGLVELTGENFIDVRGVRGSKIGKFMYNGDRPARWIDEPDAWLHGYWFWDWSDLRQPIESIDTEQRILSVKPPYHGYGYRIGQWYYAYNILAELDSPAEWYLDREAGILYFWPPAAVEDADAVVSMGPTLISMTNVSDTTFQGLTLEACRGTAVTITGGTRNRVVDCTIRNVGGHAVWILDATDSGVSGCEIYETGQGGIYLHGGDRPTLTPGGLYADNNHLYHLSRWNRMFKFGIDLKGVGNRAAHNLIHDIPHIPIHFKGNDHLIEFNELYQICREANDSGAICTGRDWTMRGTVIRYNYLHDIYGFKGHGCRGVYLDDMTCGITVYGNIFYRVTGAVFLGGGRDNLVENNIFIDCAYALHLDNRALTWASQHVDTTMTDLLKAMPYQSELWRQRYPKLVNILEDDPAAPKGNIFLRNIIVETGTTYIGGGWYDIHGGIWNYVEQFDHNIFEDEDPRFVEPPPRSYRLRDDSPALRDGFKQIPFDRIGPHPSGSHPESGR